MIAWLAANWINIVLIALIAVAVFLAIRGMLRDKKAGKCACGGNCGSCGACAGCCCVDPKAGHKKPPQAK